MADFQVADFAKNGRERIRVAVREYRGVRGIDIRVYATNSAAETVPTAKGVSVRPTLLRDLIGALQKAERALIDDGTISARESH